MAIVLEFRHGLETTNLAFKCIEICRRTVRTRCLKQSENNLITLYSEPPSIPNSDIRTKERLPFELQFGYSPGATAFNSVPGPETMGCGEERAFLRSSSICSLPPFIP